MAYRIEYAEKKNHDNKSSFGVPILLTLMCFFLFLTLVSRFWPQGREVLHLLLIPNTTEDISVVTERNYGSNLKEAAADFFDSLLLNETNH